MTKLQQVRIADIQIGKRHRKEMGDLAGLARSIQEIGLLQPIGVTPDLELVFGHRRLLACQSLDHEMIPACIVDIDAIILGEYAENEFRKDFTLSERVEIGRALEVELGERRGRPENVANCAQFPGEKTRDIVAKRAGFSSGTSYERAQFVVDTGVPELVEAVDRGEASVSAAAQVATLPVEWQRVIVANDEVAQVAKEIRNGHAHDVGARIRPHVAHNAGNNEWYTPAEYIQAAATVLGGIDLDPASTADANAVVRARKFYRAEQDGLLHEWTRRTWINPYVCTCGIDPLVLEWSHEYEDLHKMLENLSAQSCLFPRENSEGEVVFRLVQRLPSGDIERAPTCAQGRSGGESETTGDKQALQAERKGASSETSTIKHRQPKATTAHDVKMVLLDTGVMGTLSAGVELPMRILWSGGSLGTRSLHSAIASRLSRDGAREYGCSVLEMQFVEGRSASSRMVAGQASICPHCAAVGFSVTRPVTVFCNPPYSTGLIDAFAKKIALEYDAGNVTAAIVLVNNATETAWFHELVGAASAICFPRGRIKFWAPDGRIAQPLQGQALIYLGNDADAFQNAFTQFGWCARL